MNWARRTAVKADVNFVLHDQVAANADRQVSRRLSSMIPTTDVEIGYTSALVGEDLRINAARSAMIHVLSAVVNGATVFVPRCPVACIVPVCATAARPV